MSKRTLFSDKVTFWPKLLCLGNHSVDPEGLAVRWGLLLVVSFLLCG